MGAENLHREPTRHRFSNLYNKYLLPAASSCKHWEILFSVASRKKDILQAAAMRKTPFTDMGFGNTELTYFPWQNLFDRLIVQVIAVLHSD